MPWIVVQTISRREELVARRLERIGFATLTPKAKFRINGRSRIEALWPGYLLAAICEQWYAVRWCEGVSRVVMAGEQPARMPDTTIEKLQREMDKAGLVRLPKAPSPNEFHPGDRVRVNGAGPFRGLPGIYLDTAPHERIVILLTLLGAQRRLELPRADVTPLA
jgi:transcription antitermination factor NusG